MDRKARLRAYWLQQLDELTDKGTSQFDWKVHHVSMLKTCQIKALVRHLRKIHKALGDL